jgi:ribosomal protein L19E
MCEEHDGHRRGHGMRGFGFRGGRGFPNREQWVDRLQAYRQHLEQELQNVQELIERLGDAPQQTSQV